VPQSDTILIVADAILIFPAGLMKNRADEKPAWTTALSFRLVPTSAKAPERCAGSVPAGSLGSWVFRHSNWFLRNSSSCFLDL
jgi:hypothetical protein